MKRVVALAIVVICSCIGQMAFAKNKKNRSVEPSGNTTTVSNEIDEFQSIHSSRFVHVVLHKGAYAVNTTADSNLQPYVNISKKGKNLNITLDEYVKELDKKQKIIVDVTLPSIHKLEASSMSSIQSDDSFKTKELEIIANSMGKIEVNAESDFCSCNLSGMGKAKLKIDATELKIDSDSNSKITIEGNAETVNIDASGMGTVDGAKLRTSTCIVHASGMAKVSVDVLNSFEGTASGMGKIHLYGKPEHMKSNVSSMSKLQVSESIL